MEASPQIAVQAPLVDASAGGRLYVRDLQEGDSVAAVFAVRERERRSRRSGDDFLRLVVADKTGRWRPCAGRMSTISTSSRRRARCSSSRVDSRSARSSAARSPSTAAPAAEDEYSIEDLAEGPPVSIEELETRLRQLLETIQNPQLVALLDRVFGVDSKIYERFRVAPAAKYYHQAYVHGLLDHTLSVAEAVSAAAGAFRGIDRDVAVTGALLHDIGRTQAYNDDPLAIDLTDAGRLLGEIPLGYYLIRRTIESIDGFDPELAKAVLHIILSHHGKLERLASRARHP